MVYTRRPSDQRCEEIYAYITEYVAENGHSPTFREVGNAVGLRSSSTVSRYIHRLVDDGRITIDESKPRTLTAASSLCRPLNVVRAHRLPKIKIMKRHTERAAMTALRPFRCSPLIIICLPPGSSVTTRNIIPTVSLLSNFTVFFPGL